MKKILLVAILLIAINSQSQKTQTRAFYLSSQLEIGNYFGFGWDVNYLHKDKYSFNLGHFLQLSIPNNRPSDFDGDSDFFPFGDLKSISSYRAMVGRIYYFDQKRRSRLNLQLGIGFSEVDEPYNWKREGETDNGYKYDYEKRKYNTVGFVISPTIELPLYNILGLKLNPNIHFTRGEVFYGVGLGVLLGDLK
ncbi:hypothetical protein [Wenyingzhuangia sp. IMCC45574]